MWASKASVWYLLVWTVLVLLHLPVEGLLHYSSAELLRLRFQWSRSPPALRFHPDIGIQRRPRYTHRGSRRGFHFTCSKGISSFWSSTRRPPRNTGRSVNHSVLARLARSASAPLSSDNTGVSFGLLNIRSLTGKGHLVQDLLTDRKLDLLCLNETWQTPGDYSELNNATPPGFVYTCKPRGSGRGGGLAILYREKWKVVPVSLPPLPTMECLACQISGPTPTIIATVYRPPKPHTEFLNDFSGLLTHLSTLSPNVILLGDFNIHMDNTTLPLTKDFSSALDSFGFQQFSDFPTHIKGHILDLICCSGLTPSNCTADQLPITDHFLLSFDLTLRLSISKAPVSSSSATSRTLTLTPSPPPSPP